MKLEDLLKEETSLPEGVLREAVKKQAEVRKEKLSTELVGLLNTFDDSLSIQVSELRRIRKIERKQGEVVKGLGEALETFKKDGNPFPFFKKSGNLALAREFCRKVGLEMPDTDSSAWGK